VSVPRFSIGERVKVATRNPTSHMRTPQYCRGHEGIVERICGAFPNPEQLAYGKDGLPAQTLYRVRFEQQKLWPAYAGSAQDSIEIEIYDHWLEPVGS
jgi:nitrile hydratase subunit beta